MFSIDAWQNMLERHYLQIAQTMQTLPVYHPEIKVSVVPMTEIQPGRYLGGLITPWFMSWVFKLVDETGEDRHAHEFSARVGQVVTLRFPSGSYEFMVNQSEALGYYYTCALISDMHTLEDQAAAESVMTHSLRYLFDQAVKAETTRQAEIQRYAQTETVPETTPPTIETETSSEQVLTNREQGEWNQDNVEQSAGTEEVKTSKLDSKVVSRRRLFGLSRLRNQS